MKPVMIVISLALVIAGWVFVSPLFIDHAVNEDFSLVSSNGQFDLEKVMILPNEKRTQLRATIMDAASRSADKNATDGMPTAPAHLIAKGNFVDVDAIHKGSGQALLYTFSNQQNVVRFENFRSTNGPALVVYLAKHAAPKKAADVLTNGFVRLGKLKGNVGNQNYEVPPGTRIDDYHSVVIWCELFDVLFSPASLVLANNSNQSVTNHE